MNKIKEKIISKNYIIDFVNNQGCFDLQFRRDVKRKRTNAPIYYGWKAQFVITAKIDKEDLLRQIQNALGCGKIHYITGTQLRYSVQNINGFYNIIVPFFRKNPLSGNKKQDFELWAKAIEFLYQNKGKPLSQWPRDHFQRLIDIQKSIQKYKTKKIQSSKWLPIAEAVLEHLE